jgi:hypothetical protein
MPDNWPVRERRPVRPNSLGRVDAGGGGTVGGRAPAHPLVDLLAEPARLSLNAGTATPVNDLVGFASLAIREIPDRDSATTRSTLGLAR